MLFGHPSWGIVVRDDGSIYFADLFHEGRGAVWKLSTDGKLSLILCDFHAHQVLLGHDDFVYAAHGEENQVLVRININDQIDTILEVDDYREFSGGNWTRSTTGAIAFGAKNGIWILEDNYELIPFNENCFKWNQNIIEADSISFYATEIGDSSGKILRVFPDRIELFAEDLFKKTGANFDPHAHVLLGLYKDHENSLYVAETSGNRIIKIDPKGKIEEFYKSSDGWSPTGIFRRGDDYYILEYQLQGGVKGPQITRLSQSGQKEIVFNYEEYLTSGSVNDSGRERSRQWIVLPLVLLLALAVSWLKKKKKNG